MPNGQVIGVPSDALNDEAPLLTCLASDIEGCEKDFGTRDRCLVTCHRDRSHEDVLFLNGLVRGSGDEGQEGAHPYKRDLEDLEFHMLDTGHFALEEDGDRIAELIRSFLDRKVRKSAS